MQKHRMFKTLLVLIISLVVITGLMLPALTEAAEISDPRFAPQLTAIAQNDPLQVSLRWEFDSRLRPSSYDIERSLDPFSGFSVIKTVGRITLAARDQAIETGQGYYYRVRAYRKKTNEYSEYSNVAFADVHAILPADATPPTVDLVNPQDGAVFTAEQTITLSANANDDIGVERVDFFNDNVLVGSATTPPYSTKWVVSATANGLHNLKAKAYDNSGKEGVSAVKVVSVEIAAVPETYPAPVMQSVQVSGNDFILSWSLPDPGYGVPAGGYDVFTDGIDDNLHHTGLTTTVSGLQAGVEHCFTVEARWTQVDPNQFPASNQLCATSLVATPPVTAITSPASGAQYTTAQTVTILVDAQDAVGIDHVEIYDGSVMVKADSTLPYSYNWSISESNNGIHNFTVKAFNTTGLVATSAAVNLTVNIAPAITDAPPVVSISAPASVTNPQTVTITASAQDDKGINYVEIYDGDIIVKTDGTLPYSYNWAVSETANGIHNFTAKAYDTAGQVTTSAPASIVVNIAGASVDNPPSVSISSPVNGAQYSSAQTVTVVVNAQDDKGIDYVEIYDGSVMVKADSTLPYSYNWNITETDNGVHTFTAKAYDLAGQVVTSAAVSTTVAFVQQPAPTDRQPLSLRIDPAFNANPLPAEAHTWYNRLWAMINNPTQLPLNVNDMANSNDTYQYARALNTHVTTLLQVLRVTGDPKLLEEVDRIAELMRAQLKDWSITTYNGTVYQADGFLNWQYFYDAGYIGTDAHQMDEQLSHSLVAAMAYAFYVNRDLDPRYAERADFWTNYLKNHFEAKWRKRTGIATGFPFLTKKLAHVHIQWIRYHYYMYQLTGEKTYLDEAVRMAGIMDQHITETSTPYGVAAQWYHGMPILGESTLGVQRMSYARYTVHAAADLAMEGFNVFASPGFMEKMSVMLSYFVMDGGAPASFAYLIDGTSDPRETDDRYSYSPYTQLGYWDTTGRIGPVSLQVYNQLESNPEKPSRVFIPAGMFLSLMK